MDDFLPYILRPSEILRMREALDANPYLVLKGLPGSGKTRLVQDYVEKYRSSYSQVLDFKDYDIHRLTGMQKVGWNEHTKERILLIVDRFDNIFLRQDKEDLLKFLDRYRHATLHLIITVRAEDEIKRVLPYAGRMEIATFSFEEMKTLIHLFVNHYQLPDKDLYTLFELLPGTNKLPADIQRMLHFFKYQNETGQSVESILRNRIVYENKIISSPEIVSDVRVINEFLWDEIKKDPRSLYNIHPRKFEELVADMFSKLGYLVTLTPATRDNGKDMYLVEKTKFGKMLYLVECKRNEAEYPVGVGVISNLFGRVNHEKATAGIVVTSSTFSKPAMAFQSTVQYQLSLIDYSNLCGLIKSIS